MKEILENENFLNILDAFSEGVLIFSPENVLLMINKKAKEYLKVKEEVLGKKFTELSDFFYFKFIFYVLGEEIREEINKEVEIENDFILEISSLPILKEKKKIGKLIILRNVSQEKRSEKLKTEFITITAHQMRTPLASLKWSFEGLSRTKLNDFQKKLVEKGKEAAERMLRLVNEILDLAKLEEGKYVLKKEKIDFEEILKKTVEIFDQRIKEKNLKFQLKVPVLKNQKIMADKEKLKIVLENLLENAIDYTFPGGEIEISFNFRENELFFVIKDTGMGIPEKEKGNIFQKFFRASNALKEKTEGSGIGLYVTKKIIEAHGGNIWFDSEENKGSIFYFTLPLK